MKTSLRYLVRRNRVMAELTQIGNSEGVRIPQERFHAAESAFGLPPGPNRDYILYTLDNEVHHRAQGFVYLRLLGLEPPAFWER